MPNCPKCKKGFVRRSHRLGSFERLLSLCMIYPYRCQLCTQRFLAFRTTAREARHREYERIPVRFPVSYYSTYAGEQAKGEGTVMGISVRGCALLIEQPLSTGAFLRLQLHADQTQAPIEVDVSVVRSTIKNRAGLEFLTIRDQEEQRLRRLIENLLRGRAF